MLNSIIDSKKSKPAIEETIKGLQLGLENKNKAVSLAKLGSTQGLELTRAAFAVILKFTDGLEAFKRLIKNSGAS